jgi:DNA-binding transcriptional regulator YhcF (GntR family)
MMQNTERNNDQVEREDLLRRENLMSVCGRELVLKETALIVDRSVSQPIHAQVSNYIRVAIADGRLPAGVRLPSMRELADTLGVAVNTIARAYKDLSYEGLIESMPGRGSVVRSKPMFQEDVSRQRTEILKSILQPAARRARLLGYERNDILRVLEESIAVVKTPPSIGLVASSEKTLEMYRRALEEELDDLDVSIVPVILKDLKVNISKCINSLVKTKVIFSLADSFSDTRSILEARNKKVMPLLTELDIESHNQLAQLPSKGQIVLMCKKERKTQNMWLIGLYCHPARVIWLPGIEGEKDKKALRSAAAIIYDEDISREQLLEFSGVKQEVKLKFVLSVRSVQNLRNLLLVSSSATMDQ